MGSQIAQIVLFGWPLAVFFMFKRLPLREALCWSVISGYLLVPNIVGFDLPFVPPYDKELTINLSAAIMAIGFAMAARNRARSSKAAATPARGQMTSDPFETEEFVVRRGKLVFWTLIAIMFSATVITATNNSEPLVRGTRILSGLKMYDALTINMALLISLIPFLLGRRFLATPEAHIILLKIIVIACLGYSLLVLWEVRMSPQLNKQIYGFGPHKWQQHVRGGSYRPIVFMQHGLWLAIMLTMSVLAAIALWREQLTSSEGKKWLFASVYLFVVLFFCNSLGAFLIFLMLAPLVLLFGVGMQLFLAAVVSGIVLTYPLVRGSGFVPTQGIYQLASKIDTRRADSLLYRFDNEDELLAHANRKPIAGWGTWGRNRVFNERGGDIAATDGYWIIIVGVYGWLGYIAQFGLLGISTILLAVNRKRLQLTHATAGCAVVVAAALIDLLPNATISPVVWLFAGALMGRYQTAEAVKKQTNVRLAAKAQRAETEEIAEPPPDQPVHARARHLRTNRPLHQRRPREG